MKVSAAIATTILTAGLLTGCGGAPAPNESPTVSTPAASQPDPLPGVRDAAGAQADLVTGATEVEPGRLEVATSLDDEQGDDGVALCEAIAAAQPDWTYISVQDSDRTALAVFNHPRNPGVCAKV